jgi:hypothetical protein
MAGSRHVPDMRCLHDTILGGPAAVVADERWAGQQGALMLFLPGTGHHKKITDESQTIVQLHALSEAESPQHKTCL